MTEITDPFNILGSLIEKKREIDEWVAEQWKTVGLSPPIYGSIDLRNAGFKITPVDMNLFPAGFNNLSESVLSFGSVAAKRAIHDYLPSAKNILLIAENHTRNGFYWKNIKKISQLLIKADFVVEVGSLELISHEKNQIKLNNFIPDLILLNNDLSDNVPAILQNSQQIVLPSPCLGWRYRSKTVYFRHYKKIADQFAQAFQLDPWLISALYEQCDEINFMTRQGEACLIKKLSELFSLIQKKYDQYHIKKRPFIIVKADAGTYGMAVMTVRDISDIQGLNRKKRTRMAKSKSGQIVHRVILQEGVYTIDRVNQFIAEPVMYAWGKEVIGGFYRFHEACTEDENLNTPGMDFRGFTEDNIVYSYRIIAELSLLAAAHESQVYA